MRHASLPLKSGADVMAREIHSLDQIALLKALAGQQSLTGRDALFLASQLVNHGFAEAGPFIAGLREHMPGKPAQHFLARLARRKAAIAALPLLGSLQSDAALFKQFYATAGYVFRPGTHRRDLALVVFTTRFNNFSVSNLVLDALLGELGIARLYLKDVSADLYLRGVQGLAASLAELPAAIAGLLATHGIRHSIVTGFSSGGYASLYAASQLQPLGYVGFSVYTDVSTDSLLPQRAMWRALQDQVPAELLLDLRPGLNRPEQRLTLYYAARDPIDRAHALHLERCPGVKLVCHPEANHEVPAYLIEEGRFLDPFRELLAASAAGGGDA